MSLSFEHSILPRTNKEVSDQLKQIIYDLNPLQNKYLVIHSSLLTFRKFQNPIENSIRAFFEYADETGATLFFPTFTLACCKTQRYSRQNTPCDTGILSETIRKLDGVVRGRHPIDSYAAYGKNKSVVETFFGEGLHEKGSAAEFYDKNNALMVSWGAKLSYLTIIHYYEFMSDVPYRYYKTFEGILEDNGVESKYSFKFKVKNYDLLKENPSFDHLHKLLLENIPFKVITQNGAPFYATEARNIGSFLLSHLKKNPLAFLNNPEYFKQAWAASKK